MHHNDAPGLDPRTDITDLFVFQKPGDPGSSILILDVYPDAPAHEKGFDHNASYEFKIDNNQDFEAEVAFHLLFSPLKNGEQSAAVYKASGEAARKAGAVGDVILQDLPVSFTHQPRIMSAAPYRLFAGLRSDPFFADPDGFINHMQWTGKDGWWGKNVFSIVLEIPNADFGPQPRVNVWGRAMLRVHDAFMPVNQVGRPGTNVLRQGADTNSVPPARQRESFTDQYTAMFKNFGYSEAQASDLSMQWLPDVLPYDFTRAAGYPNGRQLADDVVDNIVGILTRDKMKDDLLTAHRDLLLEFPYLGIPHDV